MNEFIVPVVVLVLAIAAGAVYWTGRRVVPADHVGIIHRRWGPRQPDARFKKVTPYPARGVQARILTPHRPVWLLPGRYEVELAQAVRVPEGMVGLVSAQEGARRPPGQPLGRAVDCLDFQDGEAFLLNGGEQGRQIQTLAGDTVYYVNTVLFAVEFMPRTYIPPGTVGLVVAKAGRIRPPDRPLGWFVECENFQDGQAFLRNGGQQGRQLAVLTGGSYYDINPALFDVITIDNVGGATDGLTADHLKEVSIEVGHTGVVITLDGAEPDHAMIGPKIEGHRSFRLPWVFLAGGGYRGVQEETLGEGAVYSLNPWFVRIMLIPTRLLYLNWTNKTASERSNYDASLDQIVVNIQGYRLHVEVSQALQISRGAAPSLVSQFGGEAASGLGGLVKDPAPVQRFVERVLGTSVAKYFNEIATASSIDEFLSRYASTRVNLETQVRAALAGWGVKALETTLGEFESHDAGFNEARQEEFTEQARGKKVNVTRGIVDVEDEIDAIRFRAEDRRIAAELKAELAALGPENYVLIRQIQEIAKWKGPEYIGGNAAEYVDSLPMMFRRDLLDRMREMRQTGQLPPDPDPSPALDPATGRTEE